MSETRQIRDPVHGFISLNGKESEIIDLPIFQRLRRIRQLAMADLVYPGALHTRFDHSLGVCHVAGMLAGQQALRLGEEDRRLVRLAALLHDIGHGPFSHVSESPLEMYAHRSGDDRAVGQDRIHEIITRRVIETDKGLRDHLSTADCRKVAELLSGDGHDEPVLKSIVSGPLDADKQDYLLRDSYFCGVRYGIFDIHQLHRSLYGHEDRSTKSRDLVVSRDGVHALEQFVLAKYHISNQVYRHRVRLITDQMLVRCIVLGIDEDEIEELRKVYAYDGSEQFLLNFLEWDDRRFLTHFGDCSRFRGKCCNAIVERLTKRNLLKNVYQKRIADLPEPCRIPLQDVARPEQKVARKDLEQRIAETIRRKAGAAVDPKLVIVHPYQVKSVRVEARSDEAAIMVETSSGHRKFDDESALFRSISEEWNEFFVDVYAPVTYETPKQRRDLRRDLEDPITECFRRFSPAEEGTDHETA